MAQPLRSSALRPQSFWETIRERIDCAIAVDVVNGVIADGNYQEKPITVMQATMAWNVVNKMLPSLAAVQLQVADVRGTSMLDIKARANLLGIDPTLLLGAVSSDAIDSVTNDTCEDKSIAPADPIEAPLPPD
jgi:hypothetical protein